MRKLFFLVLAVAITFVACSAPPSTTKVASSADTITADELKELIDSGAEFVLLDVREPEELEEYGAIRGYLNIPLGQLKARISEIPQNVRVVAACGKGLKAALAAATLRKHGYKQVSSVALSEWRNKGYDLVYPKAGE